MRFSFFTNRKFETLIQFGLISLYLCGVQPHYLSLDQKICKLINLLVFFIVWRYTFPAYTLKVLSGLCFILTLFLYVLSYQIYIFNLMLLSDYIMLHESSFIKIWRQDIKSHNNPELDIYQSISNNHQQRIWTTILQCQMFWFMSQFPNQSDKETAHFRKLLSH